MAAPIVSILLLTVFCAVIQIHAQQRMFGIDYDKNTFVKDGQPFRYISGSIHYMRVPYQYWDDRLKKMAAAGLNTIQTYVPWNVHETTPNNFTFSGQQNIGKFLETAQKYNLSVILRAGPYICAEWDFGGFPAWLLTAGVKLLRTMDPSYIQAVDRWLTRLYTEVRPYLYNNGGPIITVQIENEYGSYFACDYDYLHYLKNKTISMLGDDVVLFTTDGASTQDLKCGSIPGVYATVDFGVTGNPEHYFEIQRQKQPKGPLVNSEFYTGWLDHWGQKHSTVGTTALVECLEKMLKLGANVNMYMFEGGTNFQFWNGANSPFLPVPTSYDYDAPLSEAGDITTKYKALRNVIAKFNPLPKMDIPPSTPKYGYGKVNMTYVAGVPIYAIGLKPVASEYPEAMEKLGNYYGFVLYQHQLTKNVNKGSLNLAGVRDRAYVSVGSYITPTPVAVIERNSKEMNISFTANQGDFIHILVENQGRINFGRDINNNLKGLIENVTLDGTVLHKWRNIHIDLFEDLLQEARKTTEMYHIPPPLHFVHSSSSNVMVNEASKHNFDDNETKVNTVVDVLKYQHERPLLQRTSTACVPTFFQGQLTINGEPMDTYLDMSHWTKVNTPIVPNDQYAVYRNI